jgi:hypothetical protein
VVRESQRLWKQAVDQTRLGDLSLASASHQAGLDVLGAAVGGRHPALLSHLTSLAALGERMGEDERAAALYWRILDIVEGSMINPEVASMAYLGLARLETRAAHPENARQLTQWSVDARTAPRPAARPYTREVILRTVRAQLEG